MKSYNPKSYTNITLGLNEKRLKTHLDEYLSVWPRKYGESEQNNEFVVFSSQNAIERLRVNELWAVDGTFSVVPDPYMQMCSISSIKDHHVFPCIFGILKNKNQRIYASLFGVIRGLVGNLSPEIIKTGFEAAANNALRSSYSSASY